MRFEHLGWLPAVGLLGFFTSWLFGDLLTLPVDLYYSIYFFVITTFFIFYTKRTGIDLRSWLVHRLRWGIVLGLLVGAVMVRNVTSRPPTAQFGGAMLAWAILWRGVVYGMIDGLLLFSFPWIVIGRAFGAESGPFKRKLAAGIVAWLAILFVTTLYHLGYGDFRSRKIIQPNIGSTIMAIPTLVAANPVASPIAHTLLHVAAVMHSPHTDLFLPPHREGKVRGQ
jgi:hypothetical protein